MIVLNGKHMDFIRPLSLAEFLESRDFTLDRVAVELNGVIVKKADYSNSMVQDNDVLEVVSFVGGG